MCSRGPSLVRCNGCTATRQRDLVLQSRIMRLALAAVGLYTVFRDGKFDSFPNEARA